MLNDVHILIVEDESIVAMDLALGLELDGYRVVGIADNYDDAQKIFSTETVDIILMDINIHGDKDGTETALELMKIKQVPLIYLTAYTDAITVEKVKHTNPSGFLTKPYSIENVRIAIELALHNFAQSKTPSKVVTMDNPLTEERKTEKEPFLQLEEYLFIKQNYRFVKLHLSEILFIEADNNHVNIHTTIQKFSLRLSLTELLERLNYNHLIRVHRSYAVHFEQISSFDDQLIRIGKNEIPIGRSHRQEFLDHFNLR